MTTDRDDSIRQGWGWKTEQFVVGLPEPPPSTRFADALAEKERIERLGREASWDFNIRIFAFEDGEVVDAVVRTGCIVAATLYWPRDGVGRYWRAA